MNRSNRSLRHLAFAGIYLSLAALFGCAFHHRFWAWRHEITQAQTSFLTPDGANVTSSGMIWIIPASIFAALFVVRVLRFALPADRPKRTYFMTLDARWAKHP
jgi:hypothetical protein